MAEPSQSYEQKSENYYRGRSFQQSNRPPYRGRGRGRGDNRTYNIQRTLNELGVSDLRQFLDRKHQQEQSRGGPPSDPSYNYLRDPLRENEQYYKANQTLQRSNSHRGRGRPKSQENTFIQNPMNIKVELSTSTGQRNYSLDEYSNLPDIRHIPDYSYSNYQEPRGRGNFVRGRGMRVRGRGKYIGDQPDEEQRIRAKSTERRRNGDSGSQVRSKSVEFRDRREVAGLEDDYRGRGRGWGSIDYSEPNRGGFVQRGKGRSLRGEYRGRPTSERGGYRGRPAPRGEYSGRHASEGGYRGRPASREEYSGSPAAGGEYRGGSSEGEFRGKSSEGEFRGKSSEREFRGRSSRSSGEYRDRPSEGEYRDRPSEGEYRGRPSERQYTGRGRGRGRGNRRDRGHQGQTTSNRDVQPANTEVSTEENWDSEVPIANEKHDLVDNEEHNEPEAEFIDAECDQDDNSSQQEDTSSEQLDNRSQQGEEDDNSQQDEEDDNSQLDDYYEEPTAEDLDTVYPEEEVNIEENIVITSEIGDNKKRTVRFNLKEHEGKEGNDDMEEKKQEVSKDQNP